MFGNRPFVASEQWKDRALAVLRIVTALLFLEHGTAKLLGFPETEMGQPPIWSLLWVAGIMELVGGLMLMVGFLTRPVAFLLAGQMAVAYWTVHAPQSTYPLLNGGESAILFCFIFLLFVATGPGDWSIDRKLTGPRMTEKEGYTEPEF